MWKPATTGQCIVLCAYYRWLTPGMCKGRDHLDGMSVTETSSGGELQPHSRAAKSECSQHGCTLFLKRVSSCPNPAGGFWKYKPTDLTEVSTSSWVPERCSHLWRDRGPCRKVPVKLHRQWRAPSAPHVAPFEAISLDSSMAFIMLFQALSQNNFKQRKKQSCNAQYFSFLRLFMLVKGEFSELNAFKRPSVPGR